MPAVSIIVPSYNHAQFARACVESVLAQTFTDWEMIVVDDGSSDGAPQVFRSFDDPRIQVFENPTNLGAYATQNKAVAQSSAELVAVLNDDDFWEPTKLEVQVEALRRHPEAPYSYTRGWLTDAEGQKNLTDDNYEGWPMEERLDVVPYMLDFNRIMASSVVFRRDWASFDPTLNYSGDWIANLRAAYAAPPVCVLDKLTYWRQHGENASRRFRAVTREEVRVRRSLLAREADWRRVTDRQDVVTERLGRTAYHLCALEMLWGDARASRRTARRAYRMLPDKRMGLRRMVMCHVPRALAVRRFFGAVEGPFPKVEIDAQTEIDWNLPERRRS